MAGSSGMWIAVSDEAVREAYEISRWVRKKLKESGIEKIKNIDVDKTYGIDVIEIYVKPDDAKKILERAIETLSQDIEELNKRIAEAEKTNNRNALRRLQNSLEFKRALVEVFKKKLSQLT
jgi:DNA-directed RNA polymerase subunit L